MKKLLFYISVAAIAGTTLVSCKKDKDVLDYSSQELLEALKVKSNDWVEWGFKGQVQQYTVIGYNNAEMNSSNGNLTKNNATYKYVRTFNNSGFETSYKNYSHGWDNSTSSYGTILQLFSEDQISYNDKNQVVEVIEKNYSYNTIDDTTPASIYWEKYVYTYTDTEATEILYTSDDGTTWSTTERTVYALDEYGHIDGNNYSEYETKSTESLTSQFFNKKTKDNTGNVISDLTYNIDHTSGTPVYYFYGYTEYEYIYY